MRSGEVSQYFFIYGVLVVVMFVVAAYASLNTIFDFSEQKRIVMLDGLESLIESMDVGAGTFLSGYVFVNEPVTIGIEEAEVAQGEPEAPVAPGTSSSGKRTVSAGGVERQLVLRRDAIPATLIFENSVRLRSEAQRSSPSSLELEVLPEPACDSEALRLEDLPSTVDYIDRTSDSPVTVVVLAETVEEYCSVIGLAENYPVQAFLMSPDPFSDKGVLVIAI